MPLSRGRCHSSGWKGNSSPAMGRQCCPTTELHSQPPQLILHTAVSLPTQSLSPPRSVLCTKPLCYGLEPLPVFRLTTNMQLSCALSPSPCLVTSFCDKILCSWTSRKSVLLKLYLCLFFKLLKKFTIHKRKLFLHQPLS